MYLKDRAVSRPYAQHLGMTTVDAAAGAALLGFDTPLKSSGLAIPYPNVPGYTRIRVDEGGGYLVPAERPIPIYIPPECEREGCSVLHIVEAPIKAACLQDQGLNTIGLGGVATTLTKDYSLNESWQSVAVTGRRVVIIFDAGRATNPAVARAEARLALVLEKAGANVSVAALPLRDDGKDQGPDDFVAANGATALSQVIGAALPACPVKRAACARTKSEALTLLRDLPLLFAIKERGVVVQEQVVDVLHRLGVKASLLRAALREVDEKNDGATNSGDEALNGQRYGIREGRLSLLVNDGTVEGAEPLANFAAHIVEDRSVDDGAGEAERQFLIEGQLEDGTYLPKIAVRPAEMSSDSWVPDKWGARAIVHANLARAPQHLRNAIQVVSSPLQVRAYAHTGFRQHAGRFCYLHAGGAIGADGVTVELGGSLCRSTASANFSSIVGTSCRRGKNQRTDTRLVRGEFVSSSSPLGRVATRLLPGRHGAARWRHARSAAPEVSRRCHRCARFAR
jgi:DNA polymerase-1